MGRHRPTPTTSTVIAIDSFGPVPDQRNSSTTARWHLKALVEASISVQAKESPPLIPSVTAPARESRRHAVALAREG
jgi:hypothetical protein